MKKIIFGNSIIQYRNTSWDEKIFHFSTIEIVKISSSDVKETLYILKKLEDTIKNGLIFYREETDNLFIKNILLKNGFYIAEASAILVNNNVQKSNFNILIGLSPKLVITISSYSLDNLDKLSEIDTKIDIGKV